MPLIPDPLAWAHPIVQEWFIRKFGTPTEPQEQGWPHILAGRTTLISAPTGSGKTLAAFLTCIDALVRKAIAGDLMDRTEILYISPLKALGNDIQKNLEAPLAEITALAGENGLLMPQIRTAVRTGDTLTHERQKMLKRPPHILVTTPESLYILLTADRSRAILRDVKTVIVDEIHAVADDKRGAHLALSLERLDYLTGSRSVRIGLSATQKPIEVVAHFLTGNGRPDPVVVNVGHKRELDLGIEVPGMELGPIASNDLWDEVYDRIAELVGQHRSTLVFVNTRRLAERVAFNLAERLGEDTVGAHHGSLARKLRLESETRLKEGRLKVLVATASLELGVDVGHVDLVCHISSPRSIAVALQRVGRAGHWRGAIPKGRFFPTTRDDLIECAALVRAIRQGELDRLIIPEASLDVLAQQMVAMCSAEEWNEDKLFEVVTRAYPYRALERKDYDDLLVMLSDGIVAERGRFGAHLYRDRVNRQLKARRGARMIAIMNGGAIPETALYTVVAEPEGTVVGTLHEDFAVESLKGDIVLLGNTSWRIRRVENAGRILVEDAHGAPPSIPFWLGEAPGRTEELSQQIGELRLAISDLTPNTVPGFVNQKSPEVLTTVEWLKRECGLDDSGAEQAIEYIVTGRAVLGAVPTRNTIIAERFFDEGGGMQLVVHAPFGARINKAWGLSLRKRFCVSFNFELQAAATDNGVNIALAEQHSFPLADVFHFLHENTVKEVLQQAALLSPVFETRWRWDANRALALLRYWNGKKIPLQVQRTRSADLLASVFPDVAACQENVDGPIQVPDHPLVREVMKDIFHEALDLDGLKQVLRQINSGEIKCIAVDTPIPSVFSHEILNTYPYTFLDDAPLEERRARAVEMRRVLPDSVLNEVGALDPAAIAQVRADAWPDVRDADELADVLHSLIALPESMAEDWRPLFEKLRASNRATRAIQKPTTEDTAQRGHNQDPKSTTETRRRGEDQNQESTEEYRRDPREEMGISSQSRICEKKHDFKAPRDTKDHEGDSVPQGRETDFFWVSAEKQKTFTAIYPNAQFEDRLPQVETEAPSYDDALKSMITGWLTHLGPVTASGLAKILSLPTTEIEKTLLRIESTGLILRGNFEKNGSHEIQWSERRLLARIHRLTLGSLRKQIEPVTAATFMRWLFRWQHVSPGSHVRDEHGTLEVLRQLQGFEIPASAWERQILERRISNYDPKLLDQLCMTGAVGWGRLSAHPAMLEDTAGATRRIVPTSVAPITFFVRDEAEWLALPSVRSAHADLEKEAPGLSPIAHEVLAFLRSRGASFFADIVRGSGKLKAEVETGLWELVAAGLVTADGFDNLRSLIDPKRRSGQGTGKTNRPRHSAGRWSLLDQSGSQPDHHKANEAIEGVCRMLLHRYGVVFRELLVRESILPRWREILIAFRRLEDRGEIRGGRFITSFIGEQFALPIAVESLRAMRNLPPTEETITISAADPLNLAGIVVPGERVPAISGKYVSFKDGVVVETPALRPIAIDGMR
ncbi:MAG TPA: DEAD/DEAH box helicase [Candidatus Angelobacter sp.]|jgi:ATP-dependent Lhr-like helicase|nr:DEAD/DEAH box helicase [Candidatus Angelobacter sp.]